MPLIRLIAIIWAIPNTLLGLLIGLISLCTGGCVLRRWPLKFYGGGIAWFLSRLPSDFVMAMTLGHVILGRTKAALDISREHELVHVRQYERWGRSLRRLIEAVRCFCGCEVKTVTVTTRLPRKHGENEQPSYLFTRDTPHRLQQPA